MTVDREQIREYAIDILKDRPRPRFPERWNADRSEAKTLAEHCLSLLAELEQAEKELGNAKFERDMHASAIDRLETALCGENGYRSVDNLEARLAKVPALVEAAKRVDDVENSDDWEVASRPALTALRAALDAWDGDSE